MENQLPSRTFYRTSTFMAEASFRDGKTILSDKMYTQPFKIMFPFYINKDLMTLYIQSSSAGILENDTQEMIFTINEGAKMELTQQSYEKIYRMEGGSAKRTTTIKVGKNAFFKYFPLPTIPYADSGFYSTIDVDLEDNTSELVLMEILSGGRVDSGEVFEYNFYNSHIKVRKADKLIYNDNAMYCPKKADLRDLGMYEKYTRMANLLFFNMQNRASDLEKIRAIIDADDRVEGGCSILQSGDTSIKLLGTQSQDLYDICTLITKEVTGY